MISIKSARAEELPRGHLIALMTNDSRRSVTRRGPKIGSGEAAAPHSTPWGCPFASPRNRPDVTSFHVPHPHVCGPQSHWDRCTSLRIRGARGPLRWRFHRRPLKCSHDSYTRDRLLATDYCSIASDVLVQRRLIRSRSRWWAWLRRCVRRQQHVLSSSVASGAHCASRALSGSVRAVHTRATAAPR